MEIKLKGKSVLVKPCDIELKTASGLMVKRRKDVASEGEVIDSSPFCNEVLIGDKVYYSSKAASIIKVDGVDHHLLNEHNIFLTITTEDYGSDC